VIGLVIWENATFIDNDRRHLTEEGAVTLSLFPLRPMELVGFVAIIIALVISAGGGIGGGGLLVPIFILVLRFPVKHAVGLSNVTVFGGAIANTALNASKRHPLVNRPLVDWNLLSMMEPLTMAGALIGAELNKVLPDLAVVLMLVLLLGATAYRTFRKVRCQHVQTFCLFCSHPMLYQANQMYAAETAEMENAKELSTLLPLTNTSATCNEYGTNQNSDAVSTEESSFELVHLLEQEAKVPWYRVWQLSALFLTVVTLNLIKGGGSHLSWLPFQVTCGSTAFITLQIANVVIIVVFAMYVRHTLIEDTVKKLALSYEFAKGDVVWDDTNTWKYSCVCSLAGLVAGLFGIGKSNRLGKGNAMLSVILTICIPLR
jgi:uncharacterized membrane protein YfcA